MDNHVKSFPRHAALLKEKGVPDSRDMLVTNETPYTITDKDIMQLTDQESSTYWQSRRQSCIPSPLPVFVEDDLLSQAVSEVFPEGLQSPYLSCKSFRVPVPLQPVVSPVVSSVPTPVSLPTVATSLPVTASCSMSPVPLPSVVPVPAPIPTTTVDVSEQLRMLIQVLSEGTSRQPSVTSVPVSTPPVPAQKDVQPTAAVEEDVLQQLAPAPSEEEQRRLCQQSPSRSSSSSCSSASSLERNRLLKELKAAVDKNTEALHKQATMLQELAGCVLGMSHAIATSRPEPEKQPERRPLEESKENRRDRPKKDTTKERRDGEYRHGRRDGDYRRDRHDEGPRRKFPRN